MRRIKNDKFELFVRKRQVCEIRNDVRFYLYIAPGIVLVARNRPDVTKYNVRIFLSNQNILLPQQASSIGFKCSPRPPDSFQLRRQPQLRRLELMDRDVDVIGIRLLKLLLGDLPGLQCCLIISP